MKNIVLIGMPSCGKSTVGKLISERKKVRFVDVDKHVESSYGATIPEIFSKGGEKLFRNLEKQAVKDISSLSGVVIACGGGVVLDDDNMKALKKNGVVVHIKRDINALSLDGRPLSKNLETLKNMEKARMPLYEKYADLTVNNDKNLIELAEEIIGEINENHDN